jgi:hypothetical protein
VAGSNLTKPLSSDRTIAIAIGHQEAYGVYDRVPVDGTKRLGLRRGIEDPGDREDEDASLVLTWSPRRLSERGRLATAGRIERVSTPKAFQTLPPVPAKDVVNHSINSDSAGKA